MADKKVQVKLTRSVIGRTEKIRATVRGLGLRKIGSTKILKDTPEVRGMIRKVSHLIEVTDVK